MGWYGSARLVTLVALFSSLLVSNSHAYLTLRRLENATSQGARCLDGSDALYYMYRNTESTRWVVHLETGIASCLGPGAEFCSLLRNPTQGGTSEGAPCVLPEIQSDRLSDVGVPVSSDNTRNPEFFGDNRVFIPHCSADNFVGRNLNGSLYGGDLYFGGFNIVRAVVEDLLNNQGLYSASEMLFGGAGMGVVAHTDWLRGRLPNTVLLAVYTDGLGIPTFPTFTDLQPMINESISRGDQAEFINNFTVPTDLQNFNGIYSLYATLSALNPYIPERCANDENFTFAGLECYDVPTGIRLGLASTIPVFMFASVWDTSVLASYLGLQRYTCASETGLLSEEERVYVTTSGLNNYNRLQQTYEQRGSQIISILAANCFTYSFLEDDLLCSRTGGRSPYEALQLFLAAAQISGESLTILGITNPATLTCSEYCGASQCSWGGNTTRPADTPSNCGSRLDGFGRFRTGTACPGLAFPARATSSLVETAMSLFDVVNGTERDALCLDGSPARFYMHRNTSNPNWIIHAEGGGFCASPEECQQFIDTGFGTSNNWQCSIPNVDQNGRFSAPNIVVRGTADRNPAYRTWNRVFIRYCSGDVYIGRRVRPQNLFQVHHTGHYYLTSILSDLVEFHGLLGAETILFGGTSAGGIGAQMTINLFNEQLAAASEQRGTAVPTLYGYSDGGWFRAIGDLADFSYNESAAFESPQAIPGFSTFVRLLLLFGNVENGYLDPSCQQAASSTNPGFQGHDCLGAEILWPHINVPMFLIADTWDTFDIVRLFTAERFACASTTNRITSLERAYLDRYGQYSRQFLNLFSEGQNGVFFPSCVGHAHFAAAPELFQTPPCDDINGYSAYQALSQWVSYLQSGVGVKPVLIGPDTGNFECASNCGASQCAWARNPDTTETTCPNLTPETIFLLPFFSGPACAATSPTLSPVSTTPPTASGACPEAAAAMTTEGMYVAYASCWERLFAEQQAAFNAYTSGRCSR